MSEASSTPQPIAEAPPGVPTLSAQTPLSTSDIIDLPRGRELNEAAALRLAASRPVRLIVLAGPVKGGKTTLLTSLYELFQLGPVAEHIFAESTTLPAFEERCHLARLASEGNSAETQRTPYKPEAHYLHLQTATAANPRSFNDFVFTDVSGEMFERAVDSTDECKQLAFLQRAAHLVILLDCAKAVTDSRWSMAQNAKALLRSCLDSGVLAKFCAVTVVWSKYDYFSGANPEAKLENEIFRKAVEDDFRALFLHRVRSLSFAEVAARQKKDRNLGFGKGVPELFFGWASLGSETREMLLQPTEPLGIRESEQFGGHTRT